MAAPMGIVGSVDDGGYLRFRHITVDHDELMEESLDENGVLYECPVCVGETVLMPAGGSYRLPEPPSSASGDAAATGAHGNAGEG